MSEQAENGQTEGIEPEEGAKPETDWKAEARKWERIAKAKTPKADKWDAREEAENAELQEAKELAAKYKAELDSRKAEDDRKAAVAKAAAEHKVDAALLERMGGDVEENAKFLADRDKARAPRTRDNGESPKGGGNAMAETAHMLFGRK